MKHIQQKFHCLVQIVIEGPCGYRSYHFWARTSITFLAALCETLCITICMYVKVRKTVGITNLPERPSWKNTLVPILWIYCSSILWALRGICSKYIHEFECFRSSRGTNYSFPECTCIFLTVKKGKLFFWRKKENSPAFKIFSFHQRGSIFFFISAISFQVQFDNSFMDLRDGF